MRIKRKYLLSLGLVVWILIIYLTIVNRQIGITNTNEVIDYKIQKLEKGISEQFRSNKRFINDLHEVIENKKHEAAMADSVDQPPKKEYKGIVIPVLVFACNRVSVNRCLDQLIQYRPNPDQFPIIVSQVSF